VCGLQRSFPVNLWRMDPEIQRRLRWVELFLKVKNYSVVCLRCGISRSTLRKWVRQFQENGMDGLKAVSKRPKSSPAAKVVESIVTGSECCASVALALTESKTS
jgi:transposase-like protein